VAALTAEVACLGLLRGFAQVALALLRREAGGGNLAHEFQEGVRSDTPDARGVVVRDGDDARAIRAKRRSSDLTLVPLEDDGLGASIGSPDARGPVPRGGDDTRAIRAVPAARSPACCS
jgi:hypothetical protein